MDLSSNTVLVTGGASGIGLAIANRFQEAGSKVVICGRRESKLEEARTKHPDMRTRVCDLQRESEREALAEWVTRELPELNILVNNAGIQQRLALDRREGWERLHQEIAINLEAPIHLSTLLVPHLVRQRDPAILQVTSGLAFAPLASVPIYCATKAAMHSFTLSLRHQLAATPIRVIEIAPPAVDTDLGGPGLHTFGVSVAELMSAVIPRLQAGDTEIAYGFAEKSSRASRDELDQIFAGMNQSGPPKTGPS
jgi:uncharacterized oxidoreductase